MKSMTKEGFHTITVSEETYKLLEAYRQAEGLRSISASVKDSVKVALLPPRVAKLVET